MLWRRRLAVLALAAMTSLAAAARLDAAPSPQDAKRRSVKTARNGDAASNPDRLAREDQTVVEALIERGMAEAVAVLVAGHHPVHRIEVARAWLRAGLEATDDAEKDKCFESSAQEYRAVIALEKDTSWYEGSERKVLITAAKVELGDVILRNWCAADLDRFELTSGLEYNADRLKKRLQEALAAYQSAQEALDDLQLAMKTDEEEFLLLGLSSKVPVIARQCELNESWTSVYLALLTEGRGRENKAALEQALKAFDGIASATEEVDTKYNALLGSGMCLSLMGRWDEAHGVFDRVRDSTASAATTARARYEKSRSLVRQEKFDAARREVEDLIGLGNRAGEGAQFYVRVAPLVRVNSYVREIRASRGSSEVAEPLRRKAEAELKKIADLGGAWSAIVRPYLDELAGGKRDLSQLTVNELRDNARRYMDEKRWEDAISSLEQLSNRTGTDAITHQSEARFNLGVCHFQIGNVAAAGDAFLKAAASPTAGKEGPQAAEYAYRCWQQVAQKSKAPADYARLAEAGRTLASKYPEHKLAAEAGWVAALALQEAGDFAAAQSAYSKVPADSPNFWAARRNAARCGQKAYETLPSSTTEEARITAARTAARAWLTLADELAGAPDAKFKSAAEKRSWIADARASAASLLSSHDVKEYDEALKLLTGLANDARVLALRIRCFRGKGDLKKANETLGDFLQKSTPEQAGVVLLGLSGEMEAQIDQLRTAGRRSEATALANEAVDTVKELLRWIEGQPGREQQAALVRFSLAKVLIQAEKRDEAVKLLDEMMAKDPENGTLVRQAALLHEEFAGAAPAGAERKAAEDRAETLWTKLLEDKGLRESAPQQYWEARYYWLRHQLRHGRAADVVKGIKTEQVWFPELGGPPWQARLLELLEQAQGKSPEGGSP